MTAGPSGAARAWVVVAVLAVPTAAVLLADRLLWGWRWPDPGLLGPATMAPAAGIAAVALLRRRLPGLRTALRPGVDLRVARRGLFLLAVPAALLVSWNQVCLLLGWLPVPRIDVSAGMPLPARLVAYIPLALVQEGAWRGIVLPTLRAAYGWLTAAAATGVVWGLLSAPTWRFGPLFGALSVLTTVGWSVLVGAVVTDMHRGQLWAATAFGWGTMVALFLLLPEETGLWEAGWVLATVALVGAAVAVWLYGRRRPGQMTIR